MPRKKTQTVYGGFLQWQLEDLEGKLRARMRAFRGPAPTSSELRSVLSILLLSRAAPELVLDSSSDAQCQRLKLAAFIVKFPQHAIASLRSAFQAPKPPASPSAAIREFLLTNLWVDLPNGKRVSVMGATDAEIADSVIRGSQGRFRTVSETMVKRERRRLERRYGVPVTAHVDFHLKATAGIALCYPEALRAQVERQRREAAISSLYNPHQKP